SLTADTTGTYPPRPPHVRGVRGRARIPRNRAQGDAPQRPSGVPAGLFPATHAPGVSGRDRAPADGGGVAAERGAIPLPRRIDAPDHLHRQARRCCGLLQPPLDRVHWPVLRVDRGPELDAIRPPRRPGEEPPSLAALHRYWRIVPARAPLP